MIVSTLQKQSADRLVMEETCESGARVGMRGRSSYLCRPDTGSTGNRTKKSFKI
jgi:hypothetical protein